MANDIVSDKTEIALLNKELRDKIVQVMDHGHIDLDSAQAQQDPILNQAFKGLHGTVNSPNAAQIMAAAREAVRGMDRNHDGKIQPEEAGTAEYRRSIAAVALTDAVQKANQR